MDGMGLRLSATAFILLALVVTGCSSAPNPTPTATPQAWSSNAAAGVNGCGELLTVSLHSFVVHSTSQDHISDVTGNQVQALVLVSDGVSVTKFNYQDEPILAPPEVKIELGRVHAAIQLENLRSVYVWILIVDNDQPDLLEAVVEQGASSIIGALVGAAMSSTGVGVPAGIMADFAWSMTMDTASKWIAKDDVLGDLAIVLDAAHGWGVGRFDGITSPNNGVTLNFTIDRYSNCQQLLQAPVASPASDVLVSGAPSLRACSVRAPATRLRVGDLVVSTSQIMFRPRPSQDSDPVRFDPGHVMRVLGPNECDGDIMYWKVLSPFGVEGWMAESRFDLTTNQGVYLLFPLGTSL